MKPLDWWVLCAALAAMVLYGLWRGRGTRDLGGYLVAGRRMRWPTVALSIMATQASAITFLSTPGQGYADGMRFVQFYFGLPIAMVLLCVTFVPAYRRLNVFTAYQYLEDRFDPKTRSLAAGLFLLQRGLAAGITIYAPALILSVALGWDVRWTILLIGSLVVAYSTFGGTRAVGHTHVLQMAIIWGGMFTACALVLRSLPPDVSLPEAMRATGALGKLRAVDFSFDPNNRYNVWSGLIGGLFVALSYFGTDQSQVTRYLSGQSVRQGRIGLLVNGLVKVPMQFGILFLGTLVFAFYLFVAPPLCFNPVETARVRAGALGAEYRTVESAHATAAAVRAGRARELIAAQRSGLPSRVGEARIALRRAEADLQALRGRGAALIRRSDPAAQAGDTNYIFLTFVLRFLPAGVVGLVLAAVFAASMSSTSSELSSLASTSMVDVYKRWIRPGPEMAGDVAVSRLLMLGWGAFAVGFAQFADRLGSLIEAVNILGSLFYGTILGIFLVAFHVKRVGGTAVFWAALAAEAAVILCFRFTKISWLWYNVVGCLLVIGLGVVVQTLMGRSGRERAASSP
ncbi:MAG: sodium:solute symporter [Candidatus Eisenbacteria bacterium]|nr:sodium:solute symporter [Candidatus Eisenbacteria bacterium]